MTGLDKIRKKIDEIDFLILELLNRRMGLALLAKKNKLEVPDPEREKQVIESLKSKSRGLINPFFSEKLFSEILNESKRIQEENPRTISYQGERGAYSEMAAAKFNPGLVAMPCPHFREVFEGVEKGQFDYGIVPVENSIEGAVNEVTDMLIETGLKVVAEINLPVHHCLMALPETDYREISVVYSHPQALAQCRQFIERNRFEARPHYDTAGAAMMLSRERPRASAAIASKLAAEMYGLEVLKENIEDERSNSTRFIVLSKQGLLEGGNKCAIVFSTPHKAGALFSVLKVFSDAGINLTRIESRPMRNEPGRFAFLLDFQGSENDEAIKDVLATLEAETTMMFRFLGCYGEAKE